MAVVLTVQRRGEPGEEARVETLRLDEEVIILGRDPTCRVVLSQQLVSRTHARVTRDGALCFLEDLGSAGGTSVNGRALPRGEKRLLAGGDRIAIGDFEVTFTGVDGPEAAGGDAYLRVMSGPDEGLHLPLPAGREVVLGRDEATADVAVGGRLISRRHARVLRDEAGVHLEDLESRNGVKVNGRRVERATLRDRDELELGEVRFLFVDASARQAPGAERETVPGSPPPGPASPRGGSDSPATPEGWDGFAALRPAPLAGAAQVSAPPPRAAFPDALWASAPLRARARAGTRADALAPARETPATPPPELQPARPLELQPAPPPGQPETPSELQPPPPSAPWPAARSERHEGPTRTALAVAALAILLALVLGALLLLGRL